MLDITLLQIIKTRANYDKYRYMIRDHLVDDSTKKLIHDLKAYFDHYETHIEVDWDVFPTWFKQMRHPNMKADELEFFSQVFDKMQKEPNKESAERLQSDLASLHFATIVTNKAQDMLDGKITSTKLLESTQEAVDLLVSELDRHNKVPWETSEVTELVDTLSYDNGIKFGLSCLDESCGSMHPSRFIIVGAYVDTGKSTFLADLVANTAKQTNTVLDKWYSGRPVLWFNNEGSASEIKMYCIQSALGASKGRILNNPESANAAYAREVGDKDRIRIVAAQGWHIKEAERVIKACNPCMVIYDMLDNFAGFETDGTIDQRYRALYDYARQLADIHQHVAVATSQCVGEANGVEKIEMHMLAGSRVAKQSTADLMIMIGRSLEPGKQNQRFIYTPKNKFTSKVRTADRRTFQEVNFNGEIKRYENPVKAQ